MNNLLSKSEKGKDYNICGKSSVCDYCDSIGYYDIGKCGKTKIKRYGLYNDIAINADIKPPNAIH